LHFLRTTLSLRAAIQPELQKLLNLFKTAMAGFRYAFDNKKWRPPARRLLNKEGAGEPHPGEQERQKKTHLSPVSSLMKWTRIGINDNLF
jgi:hypothetical protein